MEPANSDPNISLRYRSLLTLWFAITMSVMMFLALVYVTDTRMTGNRTLTLVLEIVAVVPFGLSFLVKQRILAKAVAEQKLDLVQSGYIAAFALCEPAALLGLVDHFANGSPYFYVGFLFAGLGMLLHFPQKKYLLAAANQQF